MKKNKVTNNSTRIPKTNNKQNNESDLRPIQKMIAKLVENEKMSPTIVEPLGVLKELDETFFLGKTHVEIIFDTDGSYFE